MKKNILLAAIAGIFIMTSCTHVYPGMVTTAKSLKTGTAKKKVWFGITGYLDVSAATAAQNGGITKIATVDHGVKGGLFSKTYITIVSGE